uniref:Uncharacterized protein n=1 Tax=Peronospora matthiolae TaxID=2874970 RepID=A0AAV1U0Z0_9STRA
MEYDHRIAGAAAARAVAEAKKATNTLKTLKRRLAKITPKPTPASEIKLPHVADVPHELPAAMAEKTREKSRAIIERLLSSYVRHRRGLPSATTATPLGLGPAEVEPPDSVPAKMPSDCPQDSEGQHSGLPMLLWPKVRPH